MKYKLYIFLCVVGLILFSCKKEQSGTSLYKVWYLVELPKKFDVKIVYSSDKQEVMGVSDTLHYTDSTYTPFLATLSGNSSKSSCWIGVHSQKNKDTPYNIGVQFGNYTQFDTVGDKKYRLMVFANDSSLIDSLQFSSNFNPMKLTGKVPVNF